MKPLEYIGVASQQVATHAVHALKIEGLFFGAADRYLQVHDSAVVPAEGAVPLRQWPIAMNSQFFQTFSAGELALANGLYLCVSSTDGTKTLAADLMDLTVELTDPELPTAVTKVGDRVTGVATKQLWSNAQGPKRLVQLYLKNVGYGAKLYFLLFCKDNVPAPGDRAIESWDVANNAERVLNFGFIGREVSSRDADGTLRVGCRIVSSTTAGVYTDPGSNSAYIEGEYK